MIPHKTCAVKVTVVFPADDLAHGVVGARIGGVYTRLAGLAAATVVGQRAINPAALGVDGQPFGSVHLGRLECVAGLARFDDHLALISKTIGCDKWALPMHQRQPLPPPVGVETRHIQDAVVQQLTIGFRATGCDLVAADELVDVLESRIFA